MNVLVVPLGGASSRYPYVNRPKWLLNMPSGKLMLEESLSLIDMSKFDNILFVCLNEHINKYRLSKMFKSVFKFKYSLIGIDSSRSQPDTVRKGLKLFGKECSFMVKDCDNRFSISDYSKHNFVCYGNIGKDFNNGDIENKSYLVKDDLGVIENIIEKQIISDAFCAGGYGFNSASDFIDAVNFLETITDLRTMYISHVIFHMMSKGIVFNAVHISQYSDWGTQLEYEKYKKQFTTLFIDIDGVLVENSAEYFEPYWGTTPSIKENVQYIKDLHRNGNVQIILTTARTEAYRNVTLNQLKEYEIPYDQIIFGMWHTKRILINDYAGSNNYRTADAINLERNSNNLPRMLGGLLN